MPEYATLHENKSGERMNIGVWKNKWNISDEAADEFIDSVTKDIGMLILKNVRRNIMELLDETEEEVGYFSKIDDIFTADDICDMFPYLMDEMLGEKINDLDKDERDELKEIIHQKMEMKE